MNWVRYFSFWDQTKKLKLYIRKQKNQFKKAKVKIILI